MDTILLTEMMCIYPGGICGTLLGFSNGKSRPRPTGVPKMPPGYLRGIMWETQVACETTMWHFFKTCMVWDRWEISWFDTGHFTHMAEITCPYGTMPLKEVGQFPFTYPRCCDYALVEKICLKAGPPIRPGNVYFDPHRCRMLLASRKCILLTD